MISIPLSYLSEKISEVLSQSAHHTNVIRLSLKAQFKAQIRCPYCGGKIRKFGFYPKQIFDAVTGTFRTLLIQRCQCKNKSCPHTIEQHNHQNVTFALFHSNLVPFTSITSEDLDFLVAVALYLDKHHFSFNLLDISVDQENEVFSDLSGRYDVKAFKPRFRRLLNYDDLILQKAFELYKFIESKVSQALTSAVSYLEAYQETPTPHIRPKQITAPPPNTFKALLAKLLSNDVIKKSTCDFLKKGNLFRKLTLPITRPVNKQGKADEV